MNKEEINNALVALVEKKNQLAETSYDNKNYDAIEDEVHELEDDFIDKYGDFLNDVLIDVHDEFCPEEEVLHPTAYIANSYKKEKDTYKVTLNDGVLVDVENLDEDEGRLVIVPNPIRVLLNMTSKQVIVLELIPSKHSINDVISKVYTLLILFIGIAIPSLKGTKFT